MGEKWFLIPRGKNVESQISGSHGGEYEDDSFPGYCAV
jgi:hypothetical protein